MLFSFRSLSRKRTVSRMLRVPGASRAANDEISIASATAFFYICTLRRFLVTCCMHADATGLQYAFMLLDAF
jgi:hypothetical protein